MDDWKATAPFFIKEKAPATPRPATRAAAVSPTIEVLIPRVTRLMAFAVRVYLSEIENV